MRVTYRDIINRSTKYNVTRSARSSMVRKMTPFTMLPSSSPAPKRECGPLAPGRST